MKVVNELSSFDTTLGVRVYQIPLEAFPGLWTFAYLVVYEDKLVLIDTGSGLGDSSLQLIEGIDEAGSSHPGRRFTLKDLTHVLITHGHIDHYGGLTDILLQSNPLVGVHELDRRNLTNYEERRVLILRKLEDYLFEAGVDAEGRENLLGLYRFTMQLFQSVEVDFCFENNGLKFGDFEFLHVPGHCAGHVVIHLHDILFCGDHILSDITPHQTPEQLTSWTGLDHYLQSLDAVEEWAGGTNLALCGHMKVITDLPARISEIRTMHMDRLEMVMDFYKSAQTIQDLSRSLFGSVNGYNALLAIEEAGAHVEYLYQRGMLVIDNYDQLESAKEPVAHYYKCQ